jgi:hypothetical protein
MRALTGLVLVTAATTAITTATVHADTNRDELWFGGGTRAPRPWPVVLHVVVERDLHLLAVAALRMLHLVQVRLHPLIPLDKPGFAVHRRLRR